MFVLCECAKDGFCTRYQRDMTGRMREICAGVDVDLGTAAAFREQWAQEKGCSMTVRTCDSPIPLCLKTNQAPGDAVAMTAAIYSLHKAYPGKYLTSVESNYPEVFQYNPHITPSTPDDKPIQMHYPAIHQSNQRGIHFMQGWCEFLGAALEHQLPLLTNRPHLYFSEEELKETPRTDYWVVCSGGKTDFTNKLWGYHNYEQVVDMLLGKVKFVQVGQNREDHPMIRYIERYTAGRTSLRDLFTLIKHSKGVLCGVSLPMHVAAALDKPAIVIAGGREPVAWNAYPKQHYLHTVGMLDCTSPQREIGACWRSRVMPLGDNVTLDRDTCLYPVNGTPTRLALNVIPRCMTLIKPQQVVDLVLAYNESPGMT